MSPAEIRALDRLLDRIDYYKLLRVERAAHAAEIRGGYHRMRRELHPDRFLSHERDLQDALDRIARRLNEGYVVLRDQTRRTAYDRGLTEGKLRYAEEMADQIKSEKAAVAGTTTNGKRFYKMSEDDERRGDFAKALANLKMALTFEPQNASFKAKIAELEPKVAEQAKAAPAGSQYTIR